MRATLEFDLPEDAEEHLDAVQAFDWRRACEEVLDHVRARLKHGEPPADEARALEEVRAIILGFAPQRER